MKQVLTIVFVSAASLLLACGDSDSPLPSDGWSEGGSGGGGAQGGDGSGGEPSSGSTPMGGGDAGGAGSGAEAGSSGSAGAPPCDDTGDGEPNEAEGEAHGLGVLDDCDSSQGTVQGILADDDVDWYRYEGTDGWGCTVDPTVAFDSDDTVQVCMFFECANGDPVQLTCPPGTSMDTSFEGRSGCCSASGFAVTSTACATVVGDDSTTVYIRVQTQPAFSCVEYSVNYHF